MLLVEFIELFQTCGFLSSTCTYVVPLLVMSMDCFMCGIKSRSNGWDLHKCMDNRFVRICGSIWIIEK